MRKDAKKTKDVEITRVHGYHEGGSYNDAESYAFAGFKGNKYFTSDRYVKLNANFTRADGKPLKGYGLEIETECFSIGNNDVLAEVLNKIIFPHFPDDLFKLQRDGSLRGESSAEAITQIMTREFIRNNYANFKVMYDTYFPAFKIACGDRCGMHVNISNGCFGKIKKMQDDAIRKLYYIVNHHYRLCCELFNRNPACTDYCAQMQNDKEYCKGLDLSHMPCSHGISFNCGHYDSGRIEIRLVGGQKNYACFRNTMETVFWLVDRVKSLSWDDCDNIVKIFQGCNQYVLSRLDRARGAGIVSTDDYMAICATIKREEFI